MELCVTEIVKQGKSVDFVVGIRITTKVVRNIVISKEK